MREFVRGHRLAEEVPLALRASESGQEFDLIRSLNAFSDKVEAETLRQSDDRSRDDARVFVVRDLADERSVDLEAVDRECADAPERAVTGTEVVELDAHAGRLEFRHYVERLQIVVHEQALGDLHAQPIGTDAGDDERVRYFVDELEAPELPGRDVDADVDLLQALGLPLGEIETCALQDPASDRNDEPGLFSDRHERAGAEMAAIRMVPTQERFGGDRFAGTQVENRLVVEDEFFAFDRAAQVVLHDHSVRDRLLHRR